MKAATWTEDKKCKATALKAAAALDKAAAAVNAFTRACSEYDAAASPRAADDGRLLLVGSMNEYSLWLESVFGRRA